MYQKKLRKILLISWIAVFGIFYVVSAQNLGNSARSGDFQPVLAKNRIVVKLKQNLNLKNLKQVNGIIQTGNQSINQLNQLFKIEDVDPLFPGSLESILAVDMGLNRVYRLRFQPTENVIEIVAAYAENPNVEYAQPVSLHKAVSITPDDYYFSRQWNLPKIAAPDAWGVTQGDSTVLLAIVDTGVDWQHPDLGGSAPFQKGSVWTNWVEVAGSTGVDDDGNGYVDDFRGWDWVNIGASSYPTPIPGEDVTDPDNDPMDFNGHGTHCAGISNAITNNTTGVAGLGWGCKIMPLRVGWSVYYYGDELGLVAMDYCAQAIQYAAQNGAKAINCSWGSGNTGGIADAVTFATNNDVVVVCAAGNSDLADASYLASRHDCIAVAATDPLDIKTSYSSYGFWVDISAPGGDSPPETNEIYSTYFDHNTNAHGYDWMRGTSMAAPHVVGLVGLINAQFGAQTWRSVKERIQFTSDDLDAANIEYKNGLLGEGRINAFQAVNQTNVPALSTIFSESFDSGLPADWTRDSYWYDDDPGRRNVNYDDQYQSGTIRVGYDIWTPPFMIIDSDYSGSTPIDASLISPKINCAQYSNIRLVFDNWFQNRSSGGQEKGDVEFRINEGPWEKIAGFIDDGYYTVVDAGKEATIRLPAKLDYQDDVQIRWRYYDANRDMFWGFDNVKLVGEMVDKDRAAIFSPAFRSIGSEAGDTLACDLMIRNIGKLSDSYDLSISNNSWTTTIRDSAGNNILTNTGELASTAKLDLQIKIEIPETASLGDVDTVVIRATSVADSTVIVEATIISEVINIGRIPWTEEFTSMTLDADKWTIINGDPQINTNAENEPSSPYSLFLKRSDSGVAEIETNPIKLVNETQVILEYYYQFDRTESGDALVIKYYDGTSWIEIARHDGDGIEPSSFRINKILLPAGAYHNNFKVRFVSEVDYQYDEWFIDNISIYQAPDIDVTWTPPNFDFVLDLGDSTKATLEIGNTGGSVIEFSISLRGNDSTLTALNQVNPPTVEEILRANHEIAQRKAMEPDASTSKAGPAKPAAPRLSLDEIINAHKKVTSGSVIRAVVIDGFGTSAVQYLAWDYLNANWADFGAQEIVIDYSTLDKDGITYADLVNSQADLLIITDNWHNGYGNFEPKELSVSECQAIVQYVNEGRGIYISAGTLNDVTDGTFTPVPNHSIFLAPLLGLSPTGVYDWTSTNDDGTPMNLVQPTHPVFLNVPNPYQLSDYMPTTCQPQSGDWNTVITAGEILAISQDQKTAIVGYKNRVYSSVMPEYSSGTNDYQFVYNVILHTSVPAGEDWMTFDPKSGTVSAGSTQIVNAGVYTRNLLPDTTYHATVIIGNNDPDEDPVSKSASLTVNPVDFYFRISPAFRDSAGRAGDTLSYVITIKNWGRLADSYDLQALDNFWPVSFWNVDGTTPISTTGSVAPKATLEFLAKVKIPDSTHYGDSDKAQIRITSTGRSGLSQSMVLQSTSVGTPATLPWSDNFPNMALNPMKWIYNEGPAEVSTLGLNEPSAPYSLNLNGDATSGDEIHSQLIDLSADTLVVLAYFYQRTGGGRSPYYGEDLMVDYLNKDGSWVNLREYPGEGADMDSFVLEEIVLPADAYHHSFQLRFHNIADNGRYDDWFIDDVSVVRPPVAEAQPESYTLKLVAGDSSAVAPLVIKNTGESDLRFHLFSAPGLNFSADLMFEPATRLYPEKYYSIRDEPGKTEDFPGIPVIHNAGGPDNFGYFWIDSDDPGGPEYRWIDISSVGAPISGLDSYRSVGPLEIGFSFPFYGNQYSTFNITRYGYISFTSTNMVSSNQPIPNTSVTNLVAPFWDDLRYDNMSSAFYHFDGEKLIIQYNNFYNSYSGPRFTFEILLYPDGNIIFQYLQIPVDEAGGTIGIQNLTGTDGLEIAYNTEYVHAQLAVQISTGVPWIKLAADSLYILPPDSSMSFPLEFTARDVDVDTVLNASLIIKSNDPRQPVLGIPAQLTVITNAYIKGSVRTAGGIIAGAKVQVWEDYPNGSVIDTVTTDDNGNYLLEVPPMEGLYTVRAYAPDLFPAFQEDVREMSVNIDLLLDAIPEFTPTIEWVGFYGNNTSFWWGPVQIGDILTVKDPDGVVCGLFPVDTPGKYGFIPVYKDDPTTDLDEGAQIGDVMSFYINNYPALAIGPESPVWTFHGSIHQVDLMVDVSRIHQIPLAAGWNLISWNVIPAEDSTKTILADILANVRMVQSHESVALTYDAENPEQSTLKIMDHLHGYWIKMNAPDTLVIRGKAVPYGSTPVYCEAGWNLVSYLPKYPDSVAHAFTPVQENLIRAFGYDQGAAIYDPELPQFSTLDILQETRGYWIWLAEADTLVYPEPIPGIYLPGEGDNLLKLPVGKILAQTNFTPTTEWISLFGADIRLDEKLLPENTIVRAVDPQGVVCGEWVITQAGLLDFMPVYRDDPQTEIDEGAVPGDEVTLFFNDLQLPITVKWTSFGEIIDLGAMVTSVTGGLKTPPAVFALEQNYPNPFNPETTIKYQLPRKSEVKLTIYSILGQEVRTLVIEDKKAGFYQVIWNGRDNAGIPVASGLYFYQLRAGDFIKTRKMIILK